MSDAVSGAILSQSTHGYLGALSDKQIRSRVSCNTLRIAPVILTFNQRKNASIKAADLIRYEYQFLVLACKLSLPNIRRHRVIAASLERSLCNDWRSAAASRSRRAFSL